MAAHASIHGGRRVAPHGWHFRWNTQVFAGSGHVVVCVNFHGSSGFGQKFLETITGRYGEKEYADIEATTDFLLKQGYIDRSRMVATGGSYGGYMVAYMNGHTDRYRCYVCHAGCYNWESMMATDGYAFFAREPARSTGRIRRASGSNRRITTSPGRRPPPS